MEQQKISTERPEGDIDRKFFSDLKKEIKKSEGELCLDIINKGLLQFDNFTQKQQEIFLKLSVDKLKLGEWKILKDKPVTYLIDLIRSKFNEENKYRDIKVGTEELSNGSIETMQEMMLDNWGNQLFNNTNDKFINDSSPSQNKNLDLKETIDETEIEKVYNEAIQKLKQTFPEIPELQSDPHKNMLHEITFQPEVTGYRKLTLKDHAITIDDPNGPLIFLDNLGGKWKIHGIKIGYQQKESLDLFQQYINQIIENKEIYTITDDILSYNPSQEGGTPIRSLGSKVLKTGVSGSKI